MNTNTSDQTAFEHHSGYIDNIGHELKTPLNAINALSGLLMRNDEQNLTSDQIDQIKIIHRSGETLAGLVDELLTLFHLRDAGGLSLDVDELSLHSLAHALQTHFDEHVQGKDITFSFVVDPLLPVIDTDNQKLLKILRNLLDNAIRFTHSGTINVAFMAGEYPEFPVSCHIADTGCGIPVEKFPLIFSAFRQLNETATRRLRAGFDHCQKLYTSLGW